MRDDTATLGGQARLGGREVRRIGYGVMQLERAGDRERALTTLRDVLAAGVDHLDTADFYGDCNAWIGQALRGAGAGARRDDAPDVVLATKVGARRDDAGALVAAQRPAQLRAQVHDNLRSLRVDRLDVVYLRRLDRPPGIIAEGDQVVDLDSQLAELAALRDEGLVDAIGLSSVSASQLRAALDVGIACVQQSYGVLDRGAEPLLQLCREHAIAWVPYFPLGSAFADRRNATEDPTVRAIAAELRATPSQVALAWLLRHDPDTLLIPGTADPAHLRENLAAGELELDAAAMTRLDALGEV